MKGLQFLAVLAAAKLAAAVPYEVERGFGCGTVASEEFVQSAALMADQERNGLLPASAAAFTTDVWFHVIARDRTVAGGYLSAATLNEQLDVLNSNYAPAGIQFNLAGTDYTVNPSWASYGNPTATRSALRKGTYSTLNVYFFYDLGGGTLGVCTLPQSVGSSPSSYAQDGCNVASGSVPGGNLSGYNQGKTATHEIGHWFGLLHTFQGQSCSGSGDQVDDTPVERTATSGCPTSKDTCPNNAGADPIHNYMDYSTE